MMWGCVGLGSQLDELAVQAVQLKGEVAEDECIHMLPRVFARSVRVCLYYLQLIICCSLFQISREQRRQARHVPGLVAVAVAASDIKSRNASIGLLS